MPKIIQNLENRLIEEARKEIEASGYGAVTIRSIAQACGVVWVPFTIICLPRKY